MNYLFLNRFKSQICRCDSHLFLENHQTSDAYDRKYSHRSKYQDSITPNVSFKEEELWLSVLNFGPKFWVIIQDHDINEET